MSIFEYDEEKEMKLLREAEREVGYEQGVERGIKQGIEQGIEQEKIDSAMRMIEDGDLPLEKIALYSDLTPEQVLELEKEKRAE